MTPPLPSIFALSPDERREAYDDAMERVTEASREIVAETKARKPDPRSIHDYRGYNTMGMVCVLLTRRSPKPASFDCSRNGAAYPRIYLPFSKCIEQPESTDDFLIVCMPKWLAKNAELLGVTPELVGDWTDAQRALWESLGRLALSINTRIVNAKRRSRAKLPFGATA